MPQKRPARELVERNPDSGQDPYSVSYKVYAFGRLKGAVLPVPDGAEDARWKALDLDGNITFFRHRNAARDFLCEKPSRTPGASR